MRKPVTQQTNPLLPPFSKGEGRGIIDTHCHLEVDEFNNDRDEVIERAKNAGIEAIITIGSDLEGCKGAIELSEKYDSVYATVGIHPHDAKDFTEDIYSQLKAWTKNSNPPLPPFTKGGRGGIKVVAIGEIGLDYHYDNSPRERQREVFKRQLALAKEKNLPVVIHSREAKKDTLDIVRESEEAGLVHWGDCYCCDCCCENLFPITRSKRYDLMTPNRFLAVVDEDKCQGCQDCVERCKFEAVEMRKTANSKKLKAFIIPEKCKGCGLCILNCKRSAIRYEIVRPPEYLLGPRSVSGQGEGPGGPAHRVPVFGYYELK